MRSHGTSLPSQVVQDLRYAQRKLARSRAFTAIAVMTFGLGIGLVTLQISFVNGALMKGLPFENADRIMAIGRFNNRGQALSIPSTDFYAWRERLKSFDVVSAYTRENLDIGGEGFDARSYPGAAFSADVCRLLGVRPLLGRELMSEDERPGAPLVVLLSHHVWRADFAADSAVVGRVIRVQGESATVIGVMPEGFAFPVREMAWVNLRHGSPGSSSPGVRSAAQMIGRLNENTSQSTAQAELQVLMNADVSSPGADQRIRARVVPYTDAASDSSLTTILFSLLAVVAGVLAIACVNVATLLSGRSLQNADEYALRAALGANRSRIVRQMLTESCVLATVGWAGGLLLASWGMPILSRAIVSPETPFWVKVDLDFSVLAVSAGVTFAAGVLSGLWPALHATRLEGGATLKNRATSGGSARSGRLNRGLVIIQIALSCAILLATSVLVDATRKGAKVDLPFDPERMLSADIRLTSAAFDTGEAQLNFQLRLLDRLRALPGVNAATFTTSLPFARMTGRSAIEARGMSTGDAVEPPRGFINPVLDGFFRDLRIPLREGREFASSDVAGSEPVAVISESLARTLWPNESAVGKTVRRKGSAGTTTEPWMTVIGVAADLPIDSPQRRQGIHVAARQHPQSQATLLISATSDPALLIRPTREAVRALSVDVPLNHPQTLTGRLSEELAPLRLMGMLALIFGAGALLLAAIGVYGVTSFSVQRRTREFGIRVALGATRKDLIRLVIGQGGRQLLTGLSSGALVGAVLCVPLLRVMAALARPPGPFTYLAVIAGIALIVSVALWWPARRAAAADPLLALRAE